MSSDKDIILGRLNAMAQIVTAHLAATKVETDQLPDLVRRLYTSLSVEEPAPTHGTPATAATPPEAPAKPALAGGRSVSVAEPLDLAGPAARVEEKPHPAVPIKESVFPDYVICLEDGKKLKSLKRHLTSAFGMTIEEYKEKWDLPDEYPTVAPNYAEMRRKVAQSIGLGKRTKDAARTAPAPRQLVEAAKAPAAPTAPGGERGRISGKKTDELRMAGALSR